jgi:TPR repeat protein
MLAGRGAGNATEFLFRTCLQLGYTVGGDERVKAQATADLLQFLRDAEVLYDEQARAIVPDCASIPDGIHRVNCVRARNGWTGDLVALARLFRTGAEVPRDDALAARLFTLAASRDHPQAKWELALMLRAGAGLPRDSARALALAREAALAGDGAGMNVYGVMLRDGLAAPPDAAEAAAWFRRAAGLRNSYAMTNLASLLLEGQGGQPVDRPAALALLRQAIYQDDNPRAGLLLADALKETDLTEADRLYRAAAAQDRDPEVKRRARDALEHLPRR